jgi:deoxyadenosine/deoxycytidine kinase
VEGPIGVGKTSLTKLLADYIQDDIRLIHEDADNPFLGDFYSDAPGSAFRTQLYFLLSRFDQLKSLRQRELFHKKVISDFMFEKDKIFAYLTLSDSELMVYEKLFDLLSPQVPEPDLVVYLTADVKTLRKRIAKRGRDIEGDIDPDYLEEVSKAYNYYFYHFSRTPLLVVNTDDIDFVNDRDDLEDLVKQIDEMDRGTRYYVPRR